ncbi:MAG: DUF4169 family protein [Dinoroseobacter sp.]|nr:DUF4169 family protein [Dinoroseobacter sp.]MDJ0994124.1 DUF4169 family protein [Dinoroseobacter sp.]
MSSVTNLRTFRKQKAREEKRVTASEKSAKHGMSKADRVRIAAQEEARIRKLDAHQIEDE